MLPKKSIASETGFLQILHRMTTFPDKQKIINQKPNMDVLFFSTTKFQCSEDFVNETYMLEENVMKQ